MCSTAIANSTSLKISMRRAQQIESRLVLADEIRPGEQSEPADRIILGRGHHPSGQRHGEQQHVEGHMSRARERPLQRRHAGGQRRRRIFQPPQQAQYRQHQHRHAEALVPREQRQLVSSERQIVGQIGEHELGDDQRGDEPVKCLRDRAVACRGTSIWHTRGSACRLHSTSLARQRGLLVFKRFAIAAAPAHWSLAGCGAPKPRQPRREAPANPRRHRICRITGHGPTASMKPIGAADPGLPSRPAGAISDITTSWSTARSTVRSIWRVGRVRVSRWTCRPRASWWTTRRRAAEEGADFAAEFPDDAKSGTLRNMLSTARARRRRVSGRSPSRAPPSLARDPRPVCSAQAAAIDRDRRDQRRGT